MCERAKKLVTALVYDGVNIPKNKWNIPYMTETTKKRFENVFYQQVVPQIPMLNVLISSTTFEFDLSSFNRKSII